MTCTTCNTGSTSVKELPKIVGGFLNLTQKCNLKCKYCFVVQQPLEMTYQVAKDAADFFAKNAKKTGKTPSITYFGGEPLLKWYDIIVPLTKYIRKTYGEKYSLSMTTNGILLDREKLEFMRNHGVTFMFSFDGDRETQDKNRPFHNGNGSFDLLIGKVPLILEFNPNAIFRSTVNNNNIYEMAHNYQFAAELGYTNTFMIPNAFADWNEIERFELENQIHKIADIYMDYLRKDREVVFSHFNTALRDIKVINAVARNKEYRNVAKDRAGRGRCGIGATQYASVGASGTLYSCQELSENPDIGDKFTMGNIYDGVNDELRWKIINMYTPEKIKSSGDYKCEECLYDDICHGGCLINNYFANGDMNIMPEIMCHFYQTVLKETIRIVNVMAEEKNEMFRRIFQRS